MKKLVTCRFISALLLAALAVTSCISEKDWIDPVHTEEGTAEISFIAGLPSVTAITTRSDLGAVAENKINDIYVLVFDKGTGSLVAKSRGKNIALASGAQNNNKVTFKATLPVGTPYTFLVLANAKTYLDNIIEVGMSPAKTKADVLDLVVTEANKWNTTSSPIPMCGERDLTLTASSNETFDLTRMLARINVEINLRDDAQGFPPDNFELTSVSYYNYNTVGALVPDKANYSGQTIHTPTLPTVPGTQIGKALTYDGLAIEDYRSCRSQIYVFEAEHNGKTYDNPQDNSDWIENPCLVIGGRYKTPDGTWLEETFYRVDFIRNDGSQDQWLSILRNFSYNVSIVEVSGSGFPDKDIALRSAPINMEAKVLEWNESDMGEIVFDGVFYLSVSRDEFTVERGEVTTEQEDYVLYVKTDYVFDNNPNTLPSGWQVEKYVDADDETQEVTWLKLNPESGLPDDRVKAYFTFEENTLPTNRTAIVWIKAGRLRYPVYVTQRVLSVYITDPEDGDKPIDWMDFDIGKNGFTSHVPRTFEVSWTPIDKDVAVTMESPAAWNPFEPDWLSPKPHTELTPAWTISGGAGQQTFTVTPPTVDQSAIDNDPFYEKETTYSFTVSNGTDQETQSITLHQVYYNIIVDTYSYRLDGSTYTVSVRSNTEWEITKIEEWLYNQDPEVENPSKPIMLNLSNYDNLRVSTTGGPNITGESLGFTVVDDQQAVHANKWGTVFVTFESPTGKFDPMRIPISFPPRTMTLMGLGNGLDVRGHNPAFAPTYHMNSANRLLTSSLNFGQTPESKVKVNDFRIVGYHCNGDIRGANPSEPWTNWYQGCFKDYLNTYNPDIVVISHGIAFSNATQLKEFDVLMDYMKNGGAVIMLHASSTASALAGTMNKIFNTTFTTSGSDAGIMRWASSPTSGGVHKVQDGPEFLNDPILNGPFGDMRGKNWGAYYYVAGVKASEIQDKAYIYSYSDDRYYASGQNALPSGYATAFRHKELNLVWFGNSGFLASYYNSINETDPFKLDNDFGPDYRPNFGYGTTQFPKNQTVYNSYFFGNMVAWAISVTNHTPPVGGY